MNIRKAHKGELDNIIFSANDSFIPHRNPNYTFVDSVPHIYNNYLHDYSDIHFIVEVDNQIVSIGANLINELKFKNETYKISRVGTISTLPEYRNKGYMAKIMEQINDENINTNIIFSVLSEHSEIL